VSVLMWVKQRFLGTCLIKYMISACGWNEKTAMQLKQDIMVLPRRLEASHVYSRDVPDRVLALVARYRYRRRHTVQG
jgi:hypothetical protein